MTWGQTMRLRQVRARELRAGDWLLIVPYVGGSPTFKRIDTVKTMLPEHPRPYVHVELDKLAEEEGGVWQVAGPHAMIFQPGEPVVLGVSA